MENLGNREGTCTHARVGCGKGATAVLRQPESAFLARNNLCRGEGKGGRKKPEPNVRRPAPEQVLAIVKKEVTLVRGWRCTCGMIAASTKTKGQGDGRKGKNAPTRPVSRRRFFLRGHTDEQWDSLCETLCLG